MKKSELREIVKQTILESQPQRAPQRQAPDREVIEKPDTAPEKPSRKRTLTPPPEAPSTKPKAESVIKEGDKEVANKIASRFAKLNKGSINENATREKAISIILKNTDKYTKEELSGKTDKELGKMVIGFIGK